MINDSALIKQVFNTKEGDELLSRIKSVCGLNDECFCETDRETAYMLGRRSIAIWLINKLEQKDDLLDQVDYDKIF